MSNPQSAWVSLPVSLFDGLMANLLHDVFSFFFLNTYVHDASSQNA